MRKLFLLILFFIAASNFVNAQCSGTVLSWINPSFEGTPGTPHVTPPGWDICMPGVTPDTQPGCWGITLPPSNGTSYVGFVQSASIAWQEGAGQTLSSPMIAGTTYNFTVDLATTAVIGSGILGGCVELQVWGGWSGVNSGCDQSELLWSSGDIFNAPHMDQWVTHSVSMTPSANYDHLLLLIHDLGCTDGPYIMVDNLSPVSPIADVPQFTWTDVCLGNTTTFTDQSTSVGTITSWDWDYGDGTTHGTAQSPTHTYTAAGTYNVTLTMISTVPCTTTVTHQVNVYANPTISVTPAAPTICISGNTSLTASGATSYSWAPATGLSSTTGTTVTANPTVTTTYTVTGTDANSCTNTATVTVTVVANPTPTVTITDASCGLNNGTATANPGGLTYTWSNSGTTQTISNLPAGTYTVTVSGGGCSGTAVGTVNNVPGGVVTLDSTDENCGHANGTAIATMVGGTAPITYAWSNSMNTQTITNLPAGSYSVTVTDANSCTASATIVVNNIAGPSAPLSNIINDNCTYGIGSVTVSPVNGTPPYSYLWSNGDLTPTISNLNAGIFGVTVTDANNCTAINSVTITDAPAPTISFSSTPSSCGQSDGSATVTASGGSGTYTYLWSNSGTSQTISNVAAGNYSVIVDDGTCTVTGNIAVIDQPGPTAAFVVNPNILSADDAVTNITDNSINAVQWAWDFGDGTTATGLVSNHVYNSTGTFVITLTVTDINGCTSTASQTVIVQPIFTIYIPNSFTPNGDGNNDFFAPTGLNFDLNKFEMYIFDRWGEEVYKTKDISKPWNGSKNNSGDKVLLDVYVYRILITELTGIKHEYLGRVSLLP